MGACAILSPLTRPDPAQSAAGIYGSYVASVEWSRALVRHGSMDQCVFVVDSLDEVRRDAEPEWSSPVDSYSASAAVTHATFADVMNGKFPNFALTAVHNPRGGPALHREAIFRRLLGARAPVTAVIHTISYPEQETDFLRILLADIRPGDALVCTSRASRIVARNRLESAASVLGTSQAAARLDRLQLPIIPLGVDIELYTPASNDTRQQARHFLHLPQDTVIILWLGRLSSKDKADLSVLLQAMRHLRQEGVSAHCAIVGEDRHQYSDTLRRLCSRLGITDCVTIVKDLPPSLVPSAYHAADIFVAPTDNVQETFGLTAVEAMASGLPVVAADWDGHRDTVSDGTTGFLIPTMWGNCSVLLDQFSSLDQWMLHHHILAETVVVSQTALQERLRQLASSRELRHRMGSAGLLEVRNRFSWKRVIGEYERLWTKLGEISASRGNPDADTPEATLGDLPYFEWFRHYATTVLGDEDLIIATSDGSRYAPQVNLFDNPALRQYLPIGLAQRLMGLCKGAPQHVADLADVMPEVDRATLMMMILWLCKHGNCRCLRMHG